MSDTQAISPQPLARVDSDPDIIDLDDSPTVSQLLRPASNTGRGPREEFPSTGPQQEVVVLSDDDDDDDDDDDEVMEVVSEVLVRPRRRNLLNSRRRRRARIYGRVKRRASFEGSRSDNEGFVIDDDNMTDYEPCRSDDEVAANLEVESVSTARRGRRAVEEYQRNTRNRNARTRSSADEPEVVIQETGNRTTQDMSRARRAFMEGSWWRRRRGTTRVNVPHFTGVNVMDVDNTGTSEAVSNDTNDDDDDDDDDDVIAITDIGPHPIPPLRHNLRTPRRPSVWPDYSADRLMRTAERMQQENNRRMRDAQLSMAMPEWRPTPLAAMPHRNPITQSTRARLARSRDAMRDLARRDRQRSRQRARQMTSAHANDARGRMRWRLHHQHHQLPHSSATPSVSAVMGPFTGAFTPMGLPDENFFMRSQFQDLNYEALLALDENLPERYCKAGVPEKIAELPRIKATAEHAADRCSICLSDIIQGETLRQLPCLHVYHPKCIDRWLVRDACCPIDKGRVRSVCRF